MSRRLRRDPLQRALALTVALGLSATAATVHAGVKLVVGADGRTRMVQDGRRAATPRPPARFAPSSTPALEELIERYSRRKDLEERLVRAVIQVESSFDPRALSRKGAMGLMQLMPETARELAVRDPWDPEQNVRGGTEYLSRMLNRFDGDLEFALAAYNAGPSAVERYGGVPPYPETRTYVEKVMRLYRGDVAYSLPRDRVSRAPGRRTYLYRDAQGRLRMSTTPPSGG